MSPAWLRLGKLSPDETDAVIDEAAHSGRVERAW